MQIILFENVKELDELSLEDVNISGSQTGSSGKAQILETTRISGSTITAVTNQAIAAGSIEDASFSRPFTITFSGDNAVLFYKDGALIGGLGADFDHGFDSIGFLATDFEAVRAGLFRLSGVNPVLGNIGLAVFGAIPQDQLASLAANPAEFVEESTSPGGLLRFGRFQNGVVLLANADVDRFGVNRAIITSSSIKELMGFQSEHVILGERTRLTSTALARYDFTGGTRSTSNVPTELGSGITAGRLLFDFSLGYGSAEMTLVHNVSTYSLLGDLFVNRGTFEGPDGIATTGEDLDGDGVNDLFGAHFSGFFTGHNGTAPLAAGLTYAVTDGRKEIR